MLALWYRTCIPLSVLQQRLQQAMMLASAILLPSSSGLARLEGSRPRLRSHPLRRKRCMPSPEGPAPAFFPGYPYRQPAVSPQTRQLED